jgi:hypothetical protein
MKEEQEEALRKMMEVLEKELEPYKEANMDYYLKLLGELEKDIRRYLSGQM